MNNAKLSSNGLQSLSYFRFFGAINIAQIISSAVIWIRDELRRRWSEEATAEFKILSESEISDENKDPVNYFIHYNDVLFDT